MNGELPLDRLYRWERERARVVFLTQPCGGGKLREWTWSQAATEVRRVAGYLKAQNWEPGSRVAILSRNCAWWMMADLAIWMAGHVTVPIYPSLRAETVRHIVEHSESKACFVGATDERDAVLAGLPPAVTPIRFPTAAAGGNEPDWETVVAASAPIEDNPTRAGDDLATIFYTSGTTGTPKGVMHRFSAFSFLASALIDRLGLAGEERIVSYLPLAHILERAGEAIPAVLLGWHVFFAEGPETFVADMQRARPTLFLSVPRLLAKFQQGVFEKVPRNKLDRLLRIPLLGRFVGKRVLRGLGLNAARCAACGSAPLSLDLLTWYRKLGLNLIEGYGLTEALITHLTKPGRVRLGCVGSPLAGVESRRAANGELLLKSPMNMIGYFKDPRGTADAFTEDGFLHTGDLVEIEDDGAVRIVGRLKEQFKTSKGKYVAPAPIEIRLAAHPDVESCCLMGSGLANPFAVVVLAAEGRARPRQAIEEALGQLLDAVNAQLDYHERVGFIVIAEEPWTVANGLVTPTLKLRRSFLEQRYLARVAAWKREGQRVLWEAELQPRHA
jgi:long-chain acyl-CoA synthetase